uniref:(California timema) hypothetical protein n=1 Tax=Timema californicum TaxID=61474 RepID=A0A7R9IY79_TIMCA|nr:unnamed protein product [Timema californicum]
MLSSTAEDGEIEVRISCSDESMDASIDAALEAGYRHIDTAYLYGNEAAIGRALKRWFDSGRLKREDLFIVTKLPIVGYQPDKVEKYLKRSLNALQLKYVDLYLVHQPWGLIETGENMCPMDESGNLLHDITIDHVALWKAMEAQVDAGRTLNIGLSNFNSRQIKRVFLSARIPPSNLQIELHVYFQQRELVAFCAALDITVCAYAPLASPAMIPAFAPLGGDVDSIPRLSPLTEPVVVKIAEKHGKTSAQVLLRHIVQRGISVIPKSSNPDRIRQNIQVNIRYQPSQGELVVSKDGAECCLSTKCSAREMAVSKDGAECCLSATVVLGSWWYPRMGLSVV